SGQDLNFEFRRTSIPDGKCPHGRSCVWPGRDDEIDRSRIVGERDVFGRRLVGVHPVRMRVVDAEECKPSFAEFLHQAHDLFGRDLVIPDRISGDVFRRERLCDYAVPPRQNPAAFSMRLAAGMLEELPKHFAPTLHHSLHSESVLAVAQLAAPREAANTSRKLFRRKYLPLGHSNFLRRLNPFPSATPLRSIRANRRPSTPRSCSPSFAGCPPPAPTGIPLRSTGSFSYRFPARCSRRRVRSRRGPCARRRANVLCSIRCLLAHPPTEKFLRCPFAA